MFSKGARLVPQNQGRTYRPLVPRLPTRASLRQQSGDLVTQIRSSSLYSPMAELAGSNLRPAPTLRLITSVATANLRLSLSPISARVGRARQQVLMLQEPDTPWHLHCVSKLDSTAYVKVRHDVTPHSTVLLEAFKVSHPLSVLSTIKRIVHFGINTTLSFLQKKRTATCFGYRLQPSSGCLQE